MGWRALSIGLLLALVTLQWALPGDRALAKKPTSVIPSISVSANTRTVKSGAKRVLVVTSVLVSGVNRSVDLAIRCRSCKRLRRAKMYRKTTATSRRYGGLYWVLPRGRGIAIDAIAAGRLGRWTVLGPGRRNPKRLVFKTSGCLRQVTRTRLRKTKCPAGTTVAPGDTPVPVAPAATAPPPPPPAPVPAPKPPPPPAPPAPPFQVCCTFTMQAASTPHLVSPDARFELIMQLDGNLVLYYRPTYHALWESHTYGSGAERAVMQQDGNLVVYHGSVPVWNSKSSGYANAKLIMQNDGNLVIYDTGGVARWQSGTSGRI